MHCAAFFPEEVKLAASRRYSLSVMSLWLLPLMCLRVLSYSASLVAAQCEIRSSASGFVSFIFFATKAECFQTEYPHARSVHLWLINRSSLTSFAALLLVVHQVLASAVVAARSDGIIPAHTSRV